MKSFNTFNERLEKEREENKKEIKDIRAEEIKQKIVDLQNQIKEYQEKLNQIK